MMTVNRGDGDAFNRRVHRGSPHQLHAFRPDMFLIAEPAQAVANPVPEQPSSIEPPMGSDFFSDTFGQEMARSMQNMEHDMQDQMRSMNEMQKQMEARFKTDFAKPMPIMQKKDTNAS